MNRHAKILVTGAEGLLGSQIVNILKKKNYKKIYPTNSKNLNLLNYKQINSFFKKNRPEIIFHTANKVYGITGNQNNSFNMLNENLVMNSNLILAAKKYKIKKIIFISSSAIYSEKLKSNIKEKNFFYGKPHKAEYYYGLSKRIFYEQLVSLNLDHKISYSYIIMNNLYGPNDNFNIENGHVIPSLIHKFYIAKRNNSYVQILGKKKDKRCFLFSEDAAKAIIKIAGKNIKLINVSSSKEYTIDTLVNKIAKIFNYNNKILWKSLGFKSPSRRKLNISLLKKTNFNESTSLNSGLLKTIKWFKVNYKNVRK